MSIRDSLTARYANVEQRQTFQSAIRRRVWGARPVRVRRVAEPQARFADHWDTESRRVTMACWRARIFCRCSSMKVRASGSE